MQPLRSVRLVTLAVDLRGPWAAARLREFGVAVTKVEPAIGSHFFARTLKVFGADGTHGSLQAFATKTAASWKPSRPSPTSR
jgi:crotonobetainyl-CoA:carnitine CoA-transferase CaiB-like acyl-CoA transferase